MSSTSLLSLPSPTNPVQCLQQPTNQRIWGLLVFISLYGVLLGSRVYFSFTFFLLLFLLFFATRASNRDGQYRELPGQLPLVNSQVKESGYVDEKTEKKNGSLSAELGMIEWGDDRLSQALALAWSGAVQRSSLEFVQQEEASRITLMFGVGDDLRCGEGSSHCSSYEKKETAGIGWAKSSNKQETMQWSINPINA